METSCSDDYHIVHPYITTYYLVIYTFQRFSFQGFQLDIRFADMQPASHQHQIHGHRHCSIEVVHCLGQELAGGPHSYWDLETVSSHPLLIVSE